MNTLHSLSNGDSRAYWEGAQEGRLLLQKCIACGVVQFPPRHLCAACWETNLAWIESSGNGTVESFTVVRRAPAAAFRDKVPYVVASVIIEEGPRMITNIVGEGALDVRIGSKVKAEFVQDDEGRVLPQFRPA